MTHDRLKERQPYLVGWKEMGHPGFLGSKRDSMYKQWNREYGEGNWKILWCTNQGDILEFCEVFGMYIEGYTEYFKKHPKEALYLTDNFSYAYDKTPINNKEDAFKWDLLYEKRGVPNQFHHVALNIALVERLGLKFKGKEPIQVRMGKSDTPKEEWPKGWWWHPGRIPHTNSKLIPKIQLPPDSILWWRANSIEDFYQRAKTLFIKNDI